MNALYLLLIPLFILICAMMKTAEIAIISIRRSWLEKKVKEEPKKLKKALWLEAHQDKMLLAMEMFFVLSAVISTVLVSEYVIGHVEIWIVGAGIMYGRLMAYALVIFLISIIFITLGKLLPKRIGLFKREIILTKARMSMLYYWTRLLSPLCHVMNAMSRSLGQFVGIREDQEEIITRDELKTILREGEQQGVLDKDEERLLKRIIDLDDIYVEEVMTPRTKVFTVDIEDLSSEYLGHILKSAHSRIPIYEDSHDNIIGILHIKDVFREGYDGGFAHIDYRELLRPAEIILETRPVDDVLREFQLKKIQLGIVINEYGSFVGIITVEEIIEEIVGEIDDEYDAMGGEIIDTKQGYVVDGLISLSSINSFFELSIESNDYSRLNGYLMANYSQEELTKGAVLNFFGRKLTVLTRDKKIVQKVLISKK